MMRQNGFTLIETVLSIGILAAGIVGVLSLFQTNIQRTDETEQTMIAAMLAQEKLEQILQDKTYQGYDYIVNGNYTSPEDLTATGYPGYTRATNILEVDSTNLTSAQNNSGYKRITVTVSVTGGAATTLESLVTEWSFPAWGS